MNKKIALIVLFVVMKATAQTDDYWSAYIPLFTSHFTLHDKVTGNPISYHDGFLRSQGGQGGLVVSYNVRYNNYIHTNTLGVSQNSFGDLIALATEGITFGRRFRIGFEGGITIGYRQSYIRNNRKGAIIDFTVKYGFTPIATSTIAYDVTERLGIKAILNPIYVNFGINYKLKGRKKIN